jgi:hypothetical protein
MENEEDILDKRYPRDYSWRRAVVYGLITAIGLASFLISISMIISLLLTSCSPLVTSPHGYVILTDSHQVAVEHQDMNRPNRGIIRYYQFPFGHGYEIGNYFKIPSTPPKSNEPELMADRNN